MRRAALLISVLVAACSPDHREILDAPKHPDAATDAAPDAAGSAAAFAMEPSPHDGNLELMVGVLGLVIAAGPVGAVGAVRRRRRRDTL